MTETAKRIRALRQDMGMTRDEFARRLFPDRPESTRQLLVERLESGHLRPTDRVCRDIDLLASCWALPALEVLR